MTSPTIILQMTGSVTPTFDFPVSFAREGNLVTMQWPAFTKSRNVANSQLFTADLVPDEYLPDFTDSPEWVVPILDGNSLTDPSTFTYGYIAFGPSGNIVISRLDQQSFSQNFVGIIGSSITYIV